MGIEIKLSDRELPVSPVFVDFLYHIVAEVPFTGAIWGDQLSETMSSEQQRLQRSAQEHAAQVMSSAVGQRAISRAYALLVGLMTGNIELIKDIQLKFHFINIIGVPRNGGSYLTKEIYRALGISPDRVPNAIAHDGFPEAGPFRFERGVNSWMTSLQTMAEFLTMVELYFGNHRPHGGKIVAPKKLTKGTYAGGFFHRILGQSVENILTVRHPVSSCISTYEKSGGWPADGKFKIRGNIEDWVRRDLAYTGTDPQAVLQMEYFDAYLRYWEQYHYYVATTGLSANREISIVAYGKERMEDLVRAFYYRFGHRNPVPESFEVFPANRERHAAWFKQAEASVRRVAEVWRTVGLNFPIDEVMEAW